MADEQTQEQAGEKQEQAQAQPEAKPEKVDEAAVLAVLADGEPKRCTMTVSDFVDCGNTAEVLLALGKLQTEAKVEQIRNPRMSQDGVEFAWQLVKKEEPAEPAKEEAPSGEQQEAAKSEGEATSGSTDS